MNTGRATIHDIPPFILEQAALGELPLSELERIRALPGWDDYRRSLEADNTAILAAYTPAAQTAAIRRRAEVKPAAAAPVRKFTLVRAFAAAVPLAAAALFTLALLQPGQSVLEAGTEAGVADVTRAKGQVAPRDDQAARSRQERLDSLLSAVPGRSTPVNAAETIQMSARSARDLVQAMAGENPRLEVWRDADGTPEALDPGSQVKAFESLQIAYTAAGRPYGMIVSLDGRGRLTLHYPDSFAARPVLSQAAPSLLGYAYQLDDAPAFERFFFITSRREFSVGEVWTKLEAQIGGGRTPAAWAGSALPLLDPGFETSAFLLVK